MRTLRCEYLDDDPELTLQDLGEKLIRDLKKMGVEECFEFDELREALVDEDYEAFAYCVENIIDFCASVYHIRVKW